MGLKVTARFMGGRRSLGFRPGQIYELEIWRDDQFIWVRRLGLPKRAPVPYGSSEAMARNWVIFM